MNKPDAKSGNVADTAATPATLATPRSDWCILQMTGQRTLRLMRSLSIAGIDAWTPVAMERKRRPRSKKFRDAPVALLPGFAFVEVGYLPELLAIIHAPVSDHPPFSILQRDSRALTASDASLDPLREYETRMQDQWQAHLDAIRREAKQKRKKTAARAYVVGQRVKIESEAFSGLVGKIVEIRNNGDLALEFTGFINGPVVPSCDVSPMVTQPSGAGLCTGGEDNSSQSQKHGLQDERDRRASRHRNASKYLGD